MYREKLNEKQETIFQKVMLNALNRRNLLDAHRCKDPEVFVSVSKRLIKEASPEIGPADLCWIQFALIESMSDY